MNKIYNLPLKIIFNISLFTFLLLLFSGCGASKYYYTKGKIHENIHVEKQIAVKIDVIQSGASYTGIGIQTLTDDIKDLLAENKLFIQNANANKILKIHVENLNENATLAYSGAVLTGLTLGFSPNIIDRVIVVNIQLDGIESSYQGEIIHTQGTGSAGKNYTQDYSINLVKNLVKNALDEFSLKYYKYRRIKK